MSVMDQQPIAVPADPSNRLGTAGVGEAFGERAGVRAGRLHRLADDAQRQGVECTTLASTTECCLERDQPLQQRRRVVLVGEVDAGAAIAGDVAQDLQDERRLAHPLRPAEQGQLAGAKPAAEIGVKHRETRRPHFGPRRLASPELPISVRQHLRESAGLIHASIGSDAAPAGHP
jgi:hypothetical protein